jgi:hypothetical protein
MRTYIIVSSTEASNFDFSQLVDNDESSSRKSLDGSKILARFEGDIPSFLIGEQQYTQEEILPITNGTEWSNPDGV